MITVTKTYLPSLETYTSYLKKIWQTNQITNNGPLVRELASALCSHLQVGHIELVANGTLALQLAIRALDLKGEIITTPYSYVASTHAIIWEGNEPVFVDINPRSFCIDPELIEPAITDKTSGILATHVYGYPCDVARIQTIADRHGLKVIYDAAHAFDVKLDGRSLLEHGDCSTLSFHATKLFHTVEGGAIVCKNIKVSERIGLMKKFGHIGEDNYLDIGINAKLSELHAAMGLAVMPEVKEIISKRRQCSKWYDCFLHGADLQRPVATTGLQYNYGYYPVVFASHEAMLQARQALLDKSIGPRRYFYPSLNTLPFLRQEWLRDCPVSEDLASRVLCLPLYVGLSKQEVEVICGYIRCTMEIEN